jgi:hypothetical protein
LSNRPSAAITVWPIDGGPLFQAPINGASATVTVIAATAGTIFRVYKIWLVTGGPTNLTFEDGTTALDGPVPMLSNGSIVLDMDGWPWFTTSVGNAFNILNSGTAQISGTVYYTQTPTTVPYDAL